MRIILRRRIRPNPASNQAEYRQLVLQTTRLTIGRAPDQHLQIDHADVSWRHALLCTVGERLCVRAVGAAIVTVNGKRRRSSWLRVGDLMTFGAARLTVEQVRSDGVVVLRLNDPSALSTDKSEWVNDLSLKGAGLKPRYWSWMLALGVLALGFLVPLAGAGISELRPIIRAAPLVPSDSLWLPGPLHDAHRAIGDDCNICHSAPFERVKNAACVACHRSIQHHVKADSADTRLFAERQCADCHTEHDGQKTLVERNSAGCVTCHADLRSVKPDTKLNNVADFSRTHPDFALTMLSPVRQDGHTDWQEIRVPAADLDTARQDSNLIFSHKVHLDTAGIDSPKGRHKLQCADCHRTDAGGETMMPIKMETHCAGCHTLQFDEHDPGSTVPHGDVPRLFQSLEEHFSRAFLDRNLGKSATAAAARRRPGDEQRILTQEEQRRALAWAQTQTAQAAEELLGKRVCVECHKINRNSRGEPGPSQWQVEPVRLTQHWLPRALFSHVIHKTSDCATCHARVAGADDSGTIQMPGVAVCRECHGDDQRNKVASHCVLCHDFHIPGRGAFSQARTDIQDGLMK